MENVVKESKLPIRLPSFDVQLRQSHTLQDASLSNGNGGLSGRVSPASKPTASATETGTLIDGNGSAVESVEGVPEPAAQTGDRQTKNVISEFRIRSGTSASFLPFYFL